jgi:fructan beta-fructosidase
MKVQKLIIAAISFLLLFAGDARSQSGVKLMKEQFRPQVHFSPKRGWMNDPNGMVYYKGVYHLFFQHYPDKTVWGPMHWGHATSKDLIHWQEQPIALYPDSLGYIFSGSAVVDVHNTTGFGKNGQAPLVAIFTHHLPDAPAGNITFQNQSLAYSVDNGKTWTKYQHNPVLKNPGIIDFRDPKVMWYEEQKKWVMTLATKDHITFYSSPDLKSWKKESEFGKEIGAHGGVWECPDLFSLNDHGKKVWVLLVNINPGGPNKGSATQYFTGSFDGEKFTPYSTETKWLDYGPDEYAGITWSNTGKRKIFIGWMSNWDYANIVPTTAWRSAATIARELKIKHVGNQLLVASEPVAELSVIQAPPVVLNNVAVTGKMDLGKKVGAIKFPCRLNLQSVAAKDFSLVLSNGLGEELVIGYDKIQNHYFIDRTKSGKIDFYNGFGARHTAPRFSIESKINLTLVIDVSSVELFADDGLTVMTEIFFPNQPYNQIRIQSIDGVEIKRMEYMNLKTIYP